MRPERTFWEKVTVIHVFCAQGAFRGGDRFARHCYDVTRLDTAGFANAAIADSRLARIVADHKRVFFARRPRMAKSSTITLLSRVGVNSFPTTTR
jgi:hypothetical protein